MMWTSCIFRFQTTYEELKLGKSKRECTVITSFQTTYEELKLWKMETIGYEFVPVFRLPMRNWNKRMVGYRGTSTMFSDYLWGIETRSFQCWVGGWWRFQTTYEELKQLIRPAASIKAIFVFRLPMRNWNTISVLIFQLILVFSDYLWGIETQETRRPGAWRPGFSDYLWGIET